MKKTLRQLLCLLLITCTLVFLVACFEEQPGTKHPESTTITPPSSESTTQPEVTDPEVTEPEEETQSHTCSGVKQNGQAATCTSDGWNDYYKCSCGKYYTEDTCINEITDLDAWKAGEGKIAASHNYGDLIPAVDAKHTPTELAPGVAAHYLCACGKYFTEAKVETTLDALTGETPVHSYSTRKYDAECHWNECSCGKKSGITEHDGGTATCIAKAKCSVCQTEYGSLGNHNYGSFVPAVTEKHTPTELAPAVAAHYYCSVCRKYFTVSKAETTLEALTGTTPEHSYGSWQTNTENHWKECSCGLKSDEAGHTYDDNADIECNTCHYVRTLPHTHGNPVKQNSQAATCTVNGWKDYYRCSCGKYYTDAACTNEITNLDAWKTGEGKIAASHIYGELIPAVAEKHTQSELIASVDAHYHCACGKYFTAEKVETTLDALTGEAPTHAYNTEAWVTDENQHWHACECGKKSNRSDHTGGTATCTAKAECEACGEEYGNLGGHTYGTLVPATEAKHTPTELAPAVAAHYHCACGKYFTATKVETTLAALTGETPAHTYNTGAWTTDGVNHWHACSCGAKSDEAGHDGGTATCTEKAECGVCGVAYGDFGGHNYGELIPAIAEKHTQSELAAAVDAHYHCACGKYFTSAKVETTLADLTGEAPTHTGGTATCTEKAECGVCGVEYGDFGGHNYGELIPSVAEKHTQTELAPAVDAHYHCACGKYFTSAKVETTLADLTGEAPSHTGGTATCTEKAECGVCGVAYGDFGGHNYGELIPAIAEKHTPTELVAGVDAHYYCDLCDTYFTSEKIETTLADLTGEAPSHTGGTATCTEKAECGVCGVAYGGFGDHNYGDLIPAVAEKHTSTELAPSVAAHYYCDLCDTYFTSEKIETTLDALTGEAPTHSYSIKKNSSGHWYACACGDKTASEGHDYHDVVSVEATCIADGTKVTVCKVCNREQGFGPIPATGVHTPKDDWEVTLEATCTAVGKEIKTCKTCDKVMQEQDIPTVPHTPTDEWIEVTPPTRYTEGEEAKRCDVCGKASEVTRAIPCDLDVDLSSYSVIYDASVSTKLFSDSAKLLAQTIGHSAKAYDDSRTKVKTEILIGETNRYESEDTLALLDKDGFAITYTGGKIAIVGTNYAYTLCGLNYFIENYLDDGKAIELPDSQVHTVNDIELASGSAFNYTFVYDADLDDEKSSPYGNDMGRDYICRTITVPWQGSGDSSLTGPDYTVDQRDNLLMELSNALGLDTSKFSSRTDTAAMTSTKEFLMGSVDRAEYREVAGLVDANEYGIFVKGDKIIFVAWNDKAMRECVRDFIQIVKDLKTASGCSLPDGFYAKGVADNTWITDFPRPDEAANINLTKSIDASDKSLQFLYTGSGVSASAFEEYCQKLEAAGYTMLTTNTIENSIFRLYVNQAKGTALNVAYNDYKHFTIDSTKKTSEGKYYVEYEKSIRVTSSPIGAFAIPGLNNALSTPNPTYTKVADSRIVAVGLNDSLVGMCYIIRLEDGSFVIYDGGYSGAEDLIWDTLVDLHTEAYGSAPTSSNPIHVSAWIITHSHFDHFLATCDLLQEHGTASNFRMDYLIGTFPAESVLYTTSGYEHDVSWLGEQADLSNVTNVKKLQGYVNNGGTGSFKYLKAFSGQKLYFANLELEVLMTYEDHPTGFYDTNDTSTITRLSIASSGATDGTVTSAADAPNTTTAIFLGDAQRYQSRYLCAMYGSYLESEMVQVAHHANNGCEKELYEVINPKTALIPNTVSTARSYLNGNSPSSLANDVGKYLMGSELTNLKYIIVSNQNYATTIKLSANGPVYELYDIWTNASLSFKTSIYSPWNGYYKKS